MAREARGDLTEWMNKRAHARELGCAGLSHSIACSDPWRSEGGCIQHRKFVCFKLARSCVAGQLLGFWSFAVAGRIFVSRKRKLRSRPRQLNRRPLRSAFMSSFILPSPQLTTAQIEPSVRRPAVLLLLSLQQLQRFGGQATGDRDTSVSRQSEIVA